MFVAAMQKLWQWGMVAMGSEYGSADDCSTSHGYGDIKLNTLILVREQSIGSTCFGDTARSGLACQASSNVALDREIIKMMIKHTMNYVESSLLKGNHCSSWPSKGSRRGMKDEIGERTLKGASTPSKDLISFVCAYRRGVVFSTLGRQQQKDLIHRVRCINSKSHTRYKQYYLQLTMACALILKFLIIFFFFFFIFVLQISSSTAQTNGTVVVGSSLTATNNATPWLLPSGDFAFGFQQLEDRDIFLVSIWYNKLPERTIVWYANGDNPSPRGSTLELTADRGLGRFQLNLGTNGNLQLGTINLPSQFRTSPYYSNGTNDSSSPSSRYQLVFNESTSIYISKDINQNFVLSRGDQGSQMNFYHRATLNFDGVFAHCRRPKTNSGNETWSTVWLIPDNICVRSFVEAGSGVCGSNKICRLRIDQRPDCQCPQRAFTLVDPNDEYRGCVPNFLQSCGEDYMLSAENDYDFDTVTNIDWPTSDYERLEPYDEVSCRRSCLLDCMCSVAIFIRGNQCWKKKLPLSNGRVDSSLNGKAFIKIKKINSPPQNPDSPSADRKNQDTIILLISVFLSSSVFVNFVLVGVICFGFLLLYRNKQGRTPKNGKRAILTYWAYDCFTESMIHTLAENDGDAISDRKKLQRFVMVAIWCIQEDPSLRPNMRKVVLMLEGIVEVTIPPCPYPFSSIRKN
ncbi:hypothetical protein LguiB_001596 [Lonicera macranthoides]